MKKNYLLFATAAIVLAGCTADDDLSAGKSTSPAQGDGAIMFSMNTPATTRADQQSGEDAATALGNEFIVWGEKNEPSTGAACASTDLVFENYRVQYEKAKTNTTVSNTKGWEYVGIAPYTSGVTSKITTGTQTIKYWDLGKTYTFTAVSAKQQDITDGKVTITKIDKTSKTTGGSPQDKGYTIVLTNGADATKIFVADRQEITAPTSAQIANASKSIAPVTMGFRNFQTKIRFGFYETVPGYNVQITGVKYTGAENEASVKTLSIKGDFVKSPTGSDQLTYNVTYKDNKPVVSIDKSASSATKQYETFGSYIFTENLNLGQKSSEPTYDQDADGTYVNILPNTGNETPMTFKVSYKLISEDTNEEILVEDRQVTVPAAYCMWKPNFAYTYLFKISDKSAELYPITFDAVVEADELSKQETITEVAGDTKNVSITTIGFNGDDVVESSVNEYSAGNIIYASVTDNGTAIPSFTNSTMKLYTVTAKDNSGKDVANVITEAAAANCVKNGGNGDTKTVTDLNKVTMTMTPVEVSTNGISYVTSVPAEDGGTARTIGAMSWKAGAAGTYYAIEYIKDDNNKYYKIVKIAIN